MQAVKETVQAICNILQAYGLEAIDPNVFRQAKHNMSEAIKPISYIMQNVLILELFDFEYKLSEIQNNNKDYDGLEIVMLALRNSPFIVYKNGKPGMDYSSSRDLLLIVGQVLAEADIFERYRKMVEKRVQNLQLNFVKKSKEQEFDIFTLKFESGGNQLKDVEQLHNIINHQFKQIQQLIKRKEAQTQQIQKIIISMNLKDFNIETIMNLQDSEQLNTICSNIKEMIQYLEFETQFHRHQEIFWAWLESIVEEDKKDVRDHPDYGFPDEQIAFPIGFQMIELIQQTQNKLTSLQDTFELFESISIQFEDAWQNVSELLQNDENSQQKLHQLQIQIHKIVAQNTLRLVSFRTYKEQVFNDKDLMYCQANDLIKYILKKQSQQQQNQQQYETNGFEQKLSLKQEQIQQRIDQLKAHIEVEIRRIKKNLKELSFYPVK